MNESLVQRLGELREEIRLLAQRVKRSADEIVIVGVTKSHSATAIEAAYCAGLSDIGENYVQELVAKHSELKELPIRWHFIGRLQSNKVKYLVPIVHLVHSVDRLSIAQELSKQAARHSRTLDILLQVNTSGEETKAGVSPNAVAELLAAVLELGNLRPCGLMTLAGLEHSPEQVRAEFRLLRSLRDELREHFSLEHFTELSMGMSSDYPIAIEEGATLLRIGTRLFGNRASKDSTDATDTTQ